MLELVLYTAIAGIIGTGIGGLIGVLFKGVSDRSMSYVLSFAGGIMVSIVCFDLFPEATGMGSLLLTAGSGIAGMFIIMALNYVVDRRSQKKVTTHVTPEGLRHEKDVIHLHEGEQPGIVPAVPKHSRSSILKAGIVMLLAIALHNLPEGLAIGAGMGNSEEFGFKLAILIALHNIPEGMTIAVPLIAGGVNKWKALGLTALSGAPTLIGGIIGFLLGGISPTVVAVALGCAGGSMLYVTYCEIMPQTILMNQGRSPAIFTLVGIVMGMIISGLVL